MEPADAFPLDDVASFVLPPLVPPSVIVFHPGEASPLLMHALATLESGGLIMNLSRAPIERYESLRSKLGEGWIVIFDRVAPAKFPERGATLTLGAPGAGAVEKPTVVDWDRDAPPNHRIDYGGLLVRRSRILSGDPLVRAIEGPVATWSARGGRADVQFGFALEESDMAARPTFLVMLINFAEWASYRGLRAFRTEYAMGEPVRAERKLWFDQGELTFAQGDRADRAAVRQGAVAASPVRGSGLHPDERGEPDGVGGGESLQRLGVRSARASGDAGRRAAAASRAVARQGALRVPRRRGRALPPGLRVAPLPPRRDLT